MHAYVKKSLFEVSSYGLVGCWIMYKVSDNQMHELVAYELMSANDVPERDPMDWYYLYSTFMSACRSFLVSI